MDEARNDCEPGAGAPNGENEGSSNPQSPGDSLGDPRATLTPAVPTTPDLTGSSAVRALGAGRLFEADDLLFPAALRLARFYAMLSPGILARELDVDRARAAHLIDLLVEYGALGPVFIARTGARESRVNMVNDRDGRLAAPVEVSLVQAGARRAAIVATVVGWVIAIGLCAGLASTGLVVGLLGSLGLGLFSPAFTKIGGLVIVPGVAGWGTGRLVELVFGPDEPAIPHGALLIRQGLWTVFAIFAVGLGSVLLFRGG